MPTDMRLSICNPAVHGGSMNTPPYCRLQTKTKIRLFVDKSICTQVKPASCIREGRPGAQNDEISCPEFIKAWYSLLTTLLETKTMIYGGNNFEV